MGALLSSHPWQRLRRSALRSVHADDETWKPIPQPFAHYTYKQTHPPRINIHLDARERLKNGNEISLEQFLFMSNFLLICQLAVAH